MVATATVVATSALAGPRQVTGVPRAEATPAGTTNVHEPEKVAEFPLGTLPKSYGPPSTPDHELIEVRGDLGYVAYTTFEVVHVFAFDLATGESRWEREVALQTDIGSVSMVATEQGLLIVMNPPRYAQFLVSLDPETGEDQWHNSANPSPVPGKVSGVVSDRLLAYDEDQDAVLAYGLEGAGVTQPKWTVPGDGGRVTEVFQETAATRARPVDPSDGLNVDVGPSPDKDQYVVHAAMYSGALAVRELDTGTVVAQGNAGEKMMDVVLYEDMVYVYRQTPRTLAAYSVTDLSSPKWSVETPVSADGSDLVGCAEDLLCLTTVGDQVTPLYAFDATNGEKRWQTEMYQSPAPVMAGDVIAVGHPRGTTVLDPGSGDVLAEFDAEKFALPGDGVLVGFDGSGVRLLAPGEQKPRDLGDVPDESMAAGNCEWTSEVAVCAGAESYLLYRYRG